MRMDAGLDTGPMLLREAAAIGPQTTTGELHDTLAALGATLIVQALDGLAQGALRETPQPAAGVTYAKKVSKDEARLDWARPAEELGRAVRAFNPAPGAWSELDGERVRILRATAEGAGAGAPGAIVGAEPDGIRVATGRGAICITELQWPGGKPLSARQAIAGRSLPGRRFV
jgi:methionyl-tRNA formyltransferase